VAGSIHAGGGSSSWKGRWGDVYRTSILGGPLVHDFLVDAENFWKSLVDAIVAHKLNLDIACGGCSRGSVQGKRIYIIIIYD